MHDERLSFEFALNLKRERRAAVDIFQEELGYRAALHRTEIGMLERGIRLPRLDTILKVAGGLEIEPAALLEGMAWRPGPYANTGDFWVASDGARPRAISGTERSGAFPPNGGQRDGSVETT